jgi:glycosyl transferase family 25
MTFDCNVISLNRTPERATRIRARLTELGIAHVLFPAVDGEKGEHHAWTNYDEARCLRRFGAPLRPAEAILLDGFVTAVAVAEDYIADCRMIRLAGLVERRHRIVADLGQRRIVRLLRGPMGTQAYMLSPGAAQSLLRGAERWVEPVDLYVDRFWVHGVLPYAILPYPAVHSDDDTASSTIGTVRFTKRTGWSKLRREFRRVGEAASRNFFNLTH